jgi:serine/threonine protein kinase/dienelactone hydrolase
MAVQCPHCHSENLEDSSFCRKCGSRISAGRDVIFSKTMTLDTTTKVLAKGSLFAGKFKILGELGHGGMGIVYKAEDTKLKRPVALKVLPVELARDDEARGRFVREAQAAAALEHPNICTIYEVEEADGLTYIAMAYIEGQTLRERVAERPFKSSEAVDTAIQIAEGLEEAHQKGVIHRDVKSSNIMITEKGQAKIMDFGLAKIAGGPMITTEAKTMGTVAYMSPEQARGEEVDHRTDIWSLGVVLYEMITGRLPFQGERETSILYAIVHEEAKPMRQFSANVPVEIQRICDHALKKNKAGRYSSAAEMLRDLRAYRDSLKAAAAGGFSLRRFLGRLRQPKLAIPAAAVVIAVACLAFWLVNRQAKARWARETLLPRINNLIIAEESGRDNLIEAYHLVQEAEKYISGDPRLSELASKCAVTISIETEPPGTRISLKKYSAPDSEWAYIGTSPLNNIRLPMGIFRWKMEKEGFETVLAASFTYRRDESRQYFNIPINLTRVLDKKESLPPGMVRVAGGQVGDIGQIEDFFIDQFEVTNRQFKEFVDQGGYHKKEFWKYPLVKEGKTLTWEEGIAEFVDQTGRAGPSTWQAGAYPQGQDNYPVSGVSWYEAAAFAEFAGKSLPTSYHWAIARGALTPLYQSAFLSTLYPLSNFQGKGPAAVGSYQGITAYGVYDMAGNVREWCWNETPQGRLVRGGAWNDINYMFGNLSQAPPFDRSPKNGFRCVRYINPQKVPETAFQPAVFEQVADFYSLSPVPDSVFQAYKDQFSYDKKALNARLESTDDKARDWIKEKVTFDTPDEDERMTAYLFLPKNSPPPYQTVIYFPGSSAQQQKSSQDLEEYVWFEVDLSYLLQNGRAVLFPIYTGTFERADPKFLNLQPESHLNTEYYIQVIKELKRSIDYLETRPDIDAAKIAFLGFSWGARLGAIIPAVEERLKVSILKSGGLRAVWRPEINQINYVTRVKIPTLMLNGRYDMTFPYEKSAKPMFDLLGTPPEDKVMKLYDTDHFIPRNEFIKETLSWLDKYFGPPKK